MEKLTPQLWFVMEINGENDSFPRKSIYELLISCYYLPIPPLMKPILDILRDGNIKEVTEDNFYFSPLKISLHNFIFSLNKFEKTLTPPPP